MTSDACCVSSECSSPDCIQLTDRELAVCETVCMDNGPVSFSHVRRSTGLHQEIVSRILRRLVNHGAVKKENGKYSCSASQ